MSRAPVGSIGEEQVGLTEVVEVAQVTPELAVGYDRDVPVVSELAELQRKDSELVEVIDYVQKGVLPTDDKRQRQLVLEGSRFAIMDGVLYYVDPARKDRPRAAVPESMRGQLLEETHSGGLAGHFATKGLYENLARRFWWRGMYGDVYRFCKGCLTCAAYRGGGRRSRPPLMPLKVGGPFERIGVDLMELPLTSQGNRYVVVFLDYLTKWVEAFPLPDQTSESIARLLIDHIICRHGVPKELLSDRGTNLLSELIQDICRLMGMKKVNTTSHHPQTDGLVENFNRTLRAMTAKHVRKFGSQWDQYLHQLLFAYRTKPHESTGESPFYLLYGRDARLPTASVLETPPSPYTVDLEDYRVELCAGLSAAWEIARGQIGIAQKRQKVQYDKRSKQKEYRVGGRVMVFMPQEAQGKGRKLALPYHGPYRIQEVRSNCLLVRPVDRPDDQPILVSMDRVVDCPSELPDTSWLGPRQKRQRRTRKKPVSTPETPTKCQYSLRSRT